VADKVGTADEVRTADEDANVEGAVDGGGLPEQPAINTNAAPYAVVLVRVIRIVAHLRVELVAFRRTTGARP
jgi:hypothetical protein